jgi:hypothetical protein
MNKVIWVVGVPNGGTSCVAGMLHHMGVDMGNVAAKPTRRPYRTFECRDRRQFGTFREYLIARLEDGQRVGVKHSAASWVDDPHPETLPVQTLYVNRPLDDCIDSGLRLWTTDRRESLMEYPNPMRFLIDRGGGIGQWHAAKELLRSVIEPTLEIDFYHILQSSFTAAIQIAHAFEIDAPADKVRKAANFVDPDMRHV